MKCSACKHANLLVLQPVVCHLHEYDASPESQIALRDKVDFFFAYDMTRLTLQAVTAAGNQSRLSSYSPSCSSLSDGVGGRSDYPLEHYMFQAAQEFHGKYGEFVVSSRDDNDVDQVTRHNYQDIVIEINRVEYLRDSRTTHKQGSWFYGEPTGSIISRGYDESDAGTGEPAPGPGTEACPADMPHPYDGFDGYTFLVYHVSVW